uniref:NADH dehydrogenase subunit 6 n=1 Tax=Nipponacmea moskalevi TaxID=1357978 RepID=UPI00286A1CFC|nr:NADH dehydrogenase subunit 6 [Nipponacmea moskalevi]WKR34935.1 NADH dehydrogenase subunit 6 [Nipponacmea moskalevi]
MPVLPFMGTPYTLGSAFMVSMVLCTGYLMSVGPLWYPAVLFLVYAGGVMVLFMYMACLSPNMRISGISRKVIYFYLVFCFGLNWVLSEAHTLVQTSLDQGEMMDLLGNIQSPLSMSSLNSGDALIFCGVFMFLALLSVVKLCKAQSGPLRPYKRSPLKKNVTTV